MGDILVSLMKLIDVSVISDLIPSVSNNIALE